MKKLSTSAVFLATLGMAAAQVNPGYNISTVTFANNIFTSNSNARPLVGDMAVFPDGRVAVAEWGVPSSLFILSGMPAASSGIRVQRFAKGLDNVMGIVIVSNTIYVMEKEALTQLVDVDGDTVADQYNNVNQAFPSDNGMLNFPYDLDYVNGNFYSAMSSDVHTGGMDWGSSAYGGTTALAGRSTAYQMNMNGTSTAFDCGFRNPNGMGINGTDIFTSENQGSWTPTSKVINIRSGRFYGHRTNPVNPCQTSNNNVESPPVVWSTFGDPEGNTTGCSWGNPHVMQRGRYPGHILVPDLCNASPNKVVRVFVQVVAGELQGVILPFIKNTLPPSNYGVMRIKEAANGDIYLGHLGASGGWGARSGMNPGLEILRDNGSTIFEVAAVRSMGSGSFEIEFTQPVGANAGQTGMYTVRQWQNVAQEAYGGGARQNLTTLTATSATVNSNRVTLAITGLQAGRIVKINYGAITSQSGAALFTNFSVYTLTRFGPGTDYQAQIVPVASNAVETTGWKLVSANGFHLVRFVGAAYVPRSAAIYDMKGTKIFQSPATQASEIRLETGRLPKGMYVVRVSERSKHMTRTLLIP